MRLITDSELARCPNCELGVLFQITAEALAESAPDRLARRNAITSLQNISRERARRHVCKLTPGF